MFQTAAGVELCQNEVAAAEGSSGPCGAFMSVGGAGGGRRKDGQGNIPTRCEGLYLVHEGLCLHSLPGELQSRCDQCYV